MVDIQTNPLYYAAAGGILLGIATSLNYVLRGKVTGMSGMVFAVVSCNMKEIPEKISIIGGMLLVSGIFFDIFHYGTSNNFTPFGPQNEITVDTSYIGFALAGLLVGFGTKLSNGCTSGHGLCGMARLSIRSFVAVCIFLTTAIGVGSLNYYQTLGPFSNPEYSPSLSYDHQISANVMLAIGVVLPLLGGFMKNRTKGQNKLEGKEIIIDQVITFVTGIIFGCGLLVSGMVRRVNILGFLAIGSDWNPSLLFVLGCGVIVNVIVFQYMIRVRKEPVFGDTLFNPCNPKIDFKLVLGAFCFGAGWGMGGLCPGPGLMMFSIFTVPIQVIWFGCMIIGMFSANFLDKYLQSMKKSENHKNPSKEIESSLVVKDNSDRMISQ